MVLNRPTLSEAVRFESGGECGGFLQFTIVGGFGFCRRRVSNRSRF